MWYQKIEWDANKYIVAWSPSPRVQETIDKVMDILWLTKKIESDILGYKNKTTKELTKIEKSYSDFLTKNSDWNIDSFMKKFFSLNLNFKPNEFARPYLDMIRSFFDKVKKSWTSYIIFSFRHWEKDGSKPLEDDMDYSLTPKGEKQATQLWERIKKEIWKDKNTSIIRLQWTHALINECLCWYLFWYNTNPNFPDSWKKLLDYAEEVKYSFDKKWDDIIMTVTRAGESLEISYSEFQKKFIN